jgi:hypothetical protein
MPQDRPGPDRDGLLRARLDGTALRHAQWREPTAQETAAAAQELREIAGGRGDLLAEVAGLLMGFYEGDPDEPRARAAAEFCSKAGADIDQVGRWTEEGRRRAEARRMPPFSMPGPRAPRPL